MEKELATEEFIHTKIVSLQIPKNIDFGFCAVSIPSDKLFKLHNYSNNAVPFAFDPCFFVFEPQIGIIQPQKSIFIRVSCLNAEAKVVIAKTCLRVEGEEPSHIKLSAVFKYPYIQLPTEKLDFGDLLVGNQTTTKIELLNPSDVPAHFIVQHSSEDDFEDKAITCSHQEGLIPPGRSFLLIFVFKPTIPEFTSSSRFIVSCKGGVSKEIQVRGHSQKIYGRFDESFLNFGSVKIGQAVAREFTFFNEVKRDLCFEFINIGGAFSIDKPRGTVQELGYVKIKIFFKPSVPANYYQKIYCLIKDQDLLSIELSGSCYDLLQKPMPIEELLERHLKTDENRSTNSRKQNQMVASRSKSIIKQETGMLPAIAKSRGTFQKNISNGFEKLKDSYPGSGNPFVHGQSVEWPANALASFKAFEKENEAQNKLTNKGKGFKLKPKTRQLPGLGKDSSECVKREIDSAIVQNIVTGAQNGGEGKWATFDALFNEEDNKLSLFSFSSTFLDFGIVDPNSNSPLTFELEVRNNHSSKTLYFFFVLKKDAFSMDRDMIALPAGHQQSLKVSFFPKVSFKFFYKKINVVICSEYPKEIEDWNVEGPKISKDPTYLNRLLRNSVNGFEIIITDYRILLLGNTFVENTQPFIPMLTLDPSETLLFQPCRTTQATFQSLMITNQTDTPCIFKVDKITGPFKVYPRAGYISKNSFTNLVIKFCPTKEAIYTERIVVRFNLNYKRTLVLKGYCLSSDLEIENEARIFFPPCHVGVKSELPCMLRNKGRMPITVDIAIPHQYAKELNIAPTKFSLLENESKSISVSFTPMKKTSYKIKCLVTTEAPGVLEDGRKQWLSILGEGGDGEITFDSKKIDFGIVMVNFIQKKKIVIRNKSDITFNVAIRLKFDEERLSAIHDAKDREINQFFALDFEEGIIPAKSFREVNIIFHPKEICSANIWLVLMTKPTESILENTDDSKEIENQMLMSQLSGTKLQQKSFTAEDTAEKMSARHLMTSAVRKINHEQKGPWNINLTGLVKNRASPAHVEDSQHVQSQIQIEFDGQTMALSQHKLKSKGYTIKDKCEIVAKANYPLLKIVDIRNDELSVASLWEKFQVSDINFELSKRLSDHEKRCGLNSRRLFDEHADLEAKNRKFIWDFGYMHNSQQSSRPRVVVVYFQNIGGTDLEWKFKENDEAYYPKHEDDREEDSGSQILSSRLKLYEKNSSKKKSFDIRPK